MGGDWRRSMKTWRCYIYRSFTDFYGSIELSERVESCVAINWSGAFGRESFVACSPWCAESCFTGLVGRGGVMLDFILGNGEKQVYLFISQSETGQSVPPKYGNRVGGIPVKSGDLPSDRN